MVRERIVCLFVLFLCLLTYASQAEATCINQCKAALVMGNCSAPATPTTWPAGLRPTFQVSCETCCSAPGGPLNCSDLAVDPQYFSILDKNQTSLTGTFVKLRTLCNNQSVIQYDQSIPIDTDYWLLSKVPGGGNLLLVKFDVVAVSQEVSSEASAEPSSEQGQGESPQESSTEPSMEMTSEPISEAIDAGAPDTGTTETGTPDVTASEPPAVDTPGGDSPSETQPDAGTGTEGGTEPAGNDPNTGTENAQEATNAPDGSVSDSTPTEQGSSQDTPDAGTDANAGKGGCGCAQTQEPAWSLFALLLLALLLRRRRLTA